MGGEETKRLFPFSGQWGSRRNEQACGWWVVPEAFRSQQKNSYYKNTAFLIEAVAFRTPSEWDLRETIEDKEWAHYTRRRQGRAGLLSQTKDLGTFPLCPPPPQGVRCPSGGPGPSSSLSLWPLATSSSAFSRLIFSAASEHAHLSHILSHFSPLRAAILFSFPRQFYCKRNQPSLLTVSLPVSP